MCPIWNTLSVRNMEHVHDTTTDDNDTELYLFCDDTYKRDNNNESGFNIFAIFIGITENVLQVHHSRAQYIENEGH